MLFKASNLATFTKETFKRNFISSAVTITINDCSKFQFHN